MTKLYIMLLILMATFCITGGLCNDFCLGPYAITFNDTQKPVLMASFGPFYSIYNDKLVSNYTSLSISNNSSFEISITESAFTFDEAYNLTKEMLNPAIGTTRIRLLDRHIDSLEGYAAEYQNKSTNVIERRAVCTFPIVFDCGSDYRGYAIIKMSAFNYTGDEFNRVPDTFRAKRFVTIS